MDSLVCSIALISFLYRREEVAVPSCPVELMKTCMPPEAVAPKMPAIKVLVCPEPMRIVADSPPTPLLPISILLLPVVRREPAVAQGDVVATGIVKERVSTIGGV